MGGPMGAAKAQGSGIRVTGKTVRLDSSVEEGGLKRSQRMCPAGEDGGQEAPQSCSVCWQV